MSVLVLAHTSDRAIQIAEARGFEVMGVQWRFANTVRPLYGMGPGFVFMCPSARKLQQWDQIHLQLKIAKRKHGESLRFVTVNG